MTDPPLQNLAAIVDEASQRLLCISDDAASRSPAPGKWSPKEIIGHLIDSAVNNHARFVRAQLQDDLVFPGYEHEAWVRLHRYNERAWTDLVDAWRASNLQIAALMRVTPGAELIRPRARHNLDQIGFQPLPPGADATLEFLMCDYIVHLQHHLAQVFSMPSDLVST